MKRTYSLPEANHAMKLVAVIAGEWLERRELRRTLDRRRRLLERATTPEGLRDELAELDARIWEQDEGISACRQEFEDLGMTVFRVNPLTIHIPGNSKNGPVVFCWQEGEGDHVCFGHPIGEEKEQRRPLKVRSKSTEA